MLGRPSVGVPQGLAPVVAAAFRQARLSDFSADQIDALTYGRGMDIGRFAAAAGFTPTYSSRAALAEFAERLDPSIRQLHSSEYRRPDQLADGPVLVVRGIGHG